MISKEKYIEIYCKGYKCEICGGVFYKKKKSGGKLHYSARSFNSKTCCRKCSSELGKRNRHKNSKIWSLKNPKKSREYSKRYREKKKHGNQ